MSNHSKIQINDEINVLWAGRSERLKEYIRNIEGVPNATYQVSGNQVFVFDKLVNLLNKQRDSQPDLALDVLAPQMVPQAMMSAIDAVTMWRIVPEPYQVAETIDGAFKIYHRPFNANLPGSYQTREELNVSLASILTGAILPGDGDISYRGQPMQLCEPLDIQSLPVRPEIHFEPVEPSVFTWLRGVTFESGFMPVNEGQFNDIKRREIEWGSDNSQIEKFAQEYATELWTRAGSLKLDTLDIPAGDVPEYEQDDLNELRLLYPELTMFSDVVLYYWFELYQMERNTLYNSWYVVRDDNFLFFLLGKVATHQLGFYNTTSAGVWVSYSFMRGDTLEDALKLGRQVALYDRAITSLTARTADAIHFLSRDKQLPHLQGPAIKTISDFLAIARKYNGAPSEINQTLADIEDISPISKPVIPYITR